MDELDREDRFVTDRINEACDLNLESVYDLVNSKARYPCAMPILIETLPQLREANIREGIVRALTVKAARGRIGDVLLAELDRTPDHYYRWVIANAFSVVAGPADGPGLVRWLENEQSSSIKKLLAVAIGKTGSNADIDALIGLLDDPIAAKEAIRALIRVGQPVDEVAVQKLKRLAASEDGVTARAATRAIERLADPTVWRGV